MKKILKKIINNKYIALILLPFILIIFWWGGSLLFNNQISFSVLVYGQKNPIVNQSSQGKLLKNQKISGEFTADENHLGIVMLRFKQFVKPDFRGEDVLSFRIKEKGKNEWYYFNNYRSGSIERQLLFPFGFPVIDDSKGKKYQFEVKSLFGNSTNAVELSSNAPMLISAYQFPKKEIAGSKLRLADYLVKKTANSFTDIDFLLSSILYLLPFIFYLLWQLFVKKLSFVGKWFAFVVLLLIIWDIVLIQEVYIGIIFALIFAWVISVKIYKIESSVSFFLAFMLLFIWIFLTFLNLHTFFNKINIWTYTFLVLGVIQAVLEEKKNLKNRINYKIFFGKALKINEKV